MVVSKYAKSRHAFILWVEAEKTLPGPVAEYNSD